MLPRNASSRRRHARGARRRHGEAQVRTTGRSPAPFAIRAAVVLDAEIQITDQATGISATTKSARDGGFVFVAVQPAATR